MQVTLPAANMWVTMVIVIIQVGVPVAIMQVLYSAVYYAHDWFYCNYAGDCFCYGYVGQVASNNFIFLFLTDVHFSSK